MSNLKAYCKKILSRFGQFLYLTISNFTKNNLWESASACAFGFIFSFIPIVLIIFTFLAAILRVNPNIYNFVMSFAQELENFIDIKPAIDAMAKMNSFKAVNIFLGIWVVWMARKLFNSIIIAMKKVFRSVSKRKTWFDQILTFIFEFIFVFVIALVTIIIFIFSKILELDFFQNIFALFPKIFTPTTHNLLVLLIYLVLFSITVIAYRFISGSKPMLKRCIFYAALSTGIFFLVSFFINMFMNTSNYNAVYGTISSLVLLMIKVYFFFVIFLFGAQMIYVSQFFEILLRSEIYLLPSNEAKDWWSLFRRFLFIKPSLIQTKENTVYFKEGETIYQEGSKIDQVYFIKEGSVCESTSKGQINFGKGAFLGDVQCLINQNHTGSAIATSDCELIRFSDQEFKAILNKSHHAARKALSKISEYTSDFYDEE
ncbi:MAG: YihY/virulence factor BrkB family protein [Treponema sp.]|nr:YihY/virulence factor BrkB family protein [Treponema sp.]